MASAIPEGPETRYSEMPRFGTDGMLDKTQIGDVVNYVLKLGGQPHDAAKAEAGKAVFTDNCVVLPWRDGTGDRAQGAEPTDAVWLWFDPRR